MTTKKTSRATRKSTKPTIAATSGVRSSMVHGQTSTKAWEFSKHLIPPITSNTTFRLGSLDRGAQGFMQFGADEGDRLDPILIYDRLDEPNTLMLEEQLALLEGSDAAISFGSGMGAISAALMSVVKSGQRIVAHRNLYGCTYSFLSEWMPRFGVETTFVDVNSAEQRLKLNDKNVRVLYFECVSNPSLDLADLPAIMRDVKKINSKRSEADRIIVIVDNTFATPWGLRPLEWGIDLVVQSLTKNIGGFGTEMGGAVMGSRKFERGLKLARKDFGAILNPKSAWGITVYGIPTLALRFEQQQKNAADVAKYLEKNSKVETVVYPGLKKYPQFKLAKKLLRTPEGDFAPGSMISFTLKGDMRRCRKFVDHVAKNSYTITLAVSLGLTKTLIEVPGYMTHAAIPKDKQAASGIDPRMIRLSLGIENSKDIIRDLDSAFRAL
ncbi:methionine gamma-lyase [soil metagenome]